MMKEKADYKTFHRGIGEPGSVVNKIDKRFWKQQHKSDDEVDK